MEDEASVLRALRHCENLLSSTVDWTRKSSHCDFGKAVARTEPPHDSLLGEQRVTELLAFVWTWN